MSKRCYGDIIELHKNYGIISTMVEDRKVKLYFNTISSMFDANHKPLLRQKVSFETRNMLWRGINIVCAYNIKSEDGPLVKLVCLNNKETDFSRYLFASLRPNSLPGKNTLDKLIETDKQISLFYLKWILFIEKEGKVALSRAIELVGKSSSWLISKLDSTPVTKKILKNALEGIKEKTWLSISSDFVVFSQKKNDPNDVEVIDAPVELLLSTVTLGELSVIIKTVFLELSLLEQKENDLYIYLWYLEGMLSDLSIIRNAAAHGNALAPLIVDDTFDPAYFYEMADVFPQWNSNDSLNNAENYKPFTFIRFLAKGEAKGGIHLSGRRNLSPQFEALFFTKSLFINPFKKSLFSMFFLVHATFAFFNNDERDNFYNDLHQSGLSFFNGDRESPFTGYPDKINSLSSKLSRIVWLVLSYGDKTCFKCFASVCK